MLWLAKNETMKKKLDNVMCNIMFGAPRVKDVQPEDLGNCGNGEWESTDGSVDSNQINSINKYSSKRKLLSRKYYVEEESDKAYDDNEYQQDPEEKEIKKKLYVTPSNSVVLGSLSFVFLIVVMMIMYILLK